MLLAADIFHPEYADQTTISTLGAAVLMPLCLAILARPRRSAVMAILFAVCFISDAQRITIAGADFTPLRILIAIGLLRIIVRHEFSHARWQRIDAAVAIYLICAFITNALLFGDIGAIIRRIGELYNYGGVYLLFRCWIRDNQDLEHMAKTFAILAITSSLFFMIEWLTARNLFSVFGGVPEITHIREGRLRCQGAFPHPILAGCFWAGALPLIGTLHHRSPCTRLLALAGCSASFFIIFACSSSTPVLAVAFIAVGLILFPLRRYMRILHIVTICLLVSLHFLMNNPVWHLLARINVIGGSTGWHRYYLIDRAIAHLDEWWLIGTKGTSHWGRGLFDVTNQYILEGVRGGVVSMLLFIAILLCAFRKIGHAVRRPRIDRTLLVNNWLVGCALFGHAAIFISVSYFGQVPAILWLTVAAAVGVSDSPDHSNSGATSERTLRDPAGYTLDNWSTHSFLAWQHDSNRLPT